MEDPQGIGDNQASAPTIGAVFYEVEPRKVSANPWSVCKQINNVAPT